MVDAELVAELHDRAQAARRRGDRAAAWAYLRAARELLPDAQMRQRLELVEAELLLDDGKVAEAQALFERLCAALPGNFLPPFKLAQMHRQRGELDQARSYIAQAIQRDPQRRMPHLSLFQVELLAAMGRAGEARDRFAEALARHPRAPALLRRLYAHEIRFADPKLLFDVHRLLQRDAPPELMQELEVRLLIATQQFSAALALLRAPGRRRTAAEAGRLAAVLFGCHRYRLALRYLRLALQRYPGDQALADLYIARCLEFGADDAAAAWIEAGAGTLPPRVTEARRLMLAANRGDLAAVTEAYAALKAGGHLRAEHREVLAKMLFGQTAPFAEARELLRTRTGPPLEGTAGPLHRQGVVGQMMMEVALEETALDEQGPFDSPAAWARARPGSIVAAQGLVSAWAAGAETGLGADPATPWSADRQAAATAPAPRQVLQYWDGPERPDTVARMMERWDGGLPGFGYRCFDRASALRLIGERFAPAWGRAFRLAQNPEQEADLVRLLVLASEGGLWVDANVALVGDLEPILQRGGGVILCRDRPGGTLGLHFVAAPPKHPLILQAAELVREALLTRAGEVAWTKTGPGPMTRAAAGFLLGAGTGLAARALHLVEARDSLAAIAAGRPVTYKGLARHWGRIDREKTRLWRTLAEALEELPDRS